jgi:hypothetical protein
MLPKYTRNLSCIIPEYVDLEYAYSKDFEHAISASPEELLSRSYRKWKPNTRPPSGKARLRERLIVGVMIVLVGLIVLYVLNTKDLFNVSKWTIF